MEPKSLSVLVLFLITVTVAEETAGHHLDHIRKSGQAGERMRAGSHRSSEALYVPESRMAVQTVHRMSCKKDTIRGERFRGTPRHQTCRLSMNWDLDNYPTERFYAEGPMPMTGKLPPKTILIPFSSTGKTATRILTHTFRRGKKPIFSAMWCTFLVLTKSRAVEVARGKYTHKWEC